MASETMKDGSERRGENTWLWQSLTLRIVENTLDLADLQPVVESVQPEFIEVTISRRAAGPMASGLYPEYALLAVVAAVGYAFLAELGKDAYRACRTALFAAYKKTRTWANDRGYHPFGIELTGDEQGAGEESHKKMFFTFSPDMDQAEFEEALLALTEGYEDIDLGEADDFLELGYESASKTWTVIQRDGIPARSPDE